MAIPITKNNITAAAGRFEVPFETNMFLRIVNYPEWVDRIYPPYFLGNKAQKKFLVSYLKNDTGQQRTGTIKIEASTCSSGDVVCEYNVNMTQAGPAAS